MKKSGAMKILIVSVLFALIAQIVHTIGAALSMEYYQMHEYFYVWSKLMMPTQGAPPAIFYVISILFSILTGFLFSYVFKIIKKGIPGNSMVKRGLSYGLVLFLIGSLPYTFALILLINLPIGLITLWAAENLVIDLLGGMLIIKMVK